MSKAQMLKYFTKPGTVDNKNPYKEKSESPQQCSSSMNVDSQGFTLESQSYGHNDDIHIQRNLSPNDSGNNVENVHHSEANVSSTMIIIYQRWISRKIYLKATGKKKTMNHKLMTNKAVLRTLLNALYHLKA